MKLIIDIPNNVYIACNEYKDNTNIGILQRILYIAISNGIPFEEELEKVKNDIYFMPYITGGASADRAQVVSYLNKKISELKGEQRMNNKNKYIHIDDVYRLIAGHSIYGGDDILSAFTCLTEGKEVKPIEPLDITYHEISQLQKVKENKEK